MAEGGRGHRRPSIAQRLRLALQGKGLVDYDQPLTHWELLAMAKMPEGEVNARLLEIAQQSRPDDPEAERARLLKKRQRFGVTYTLDEIELAAISDIDPDKVNMVMAALALANRPDAPEAELERLWLLRRRWQVAKLPDC